MASLNISDVNPLPPGWDCKYDNLTGKRYYINYFTRNTSLEDPRVQMTDAIPLQDFTSNNRLGLMMGTNSLKRQQSAVDSQQTTSTEQAVAKISSMFPTVTETHIRTLLLKYHNREAVVMSALQVEKHPLTMPGPYTPPMGARPLPGLGLYAVTPPHTPRVGPRGPLLTSPKPHSPKMKLRYLKSVFPVVEETILLDTLCSSDNNVNLATQTLLTMGFDKRCPPTPPPRVCLQRQTPIHTPPPTPHRMKSIEEKQEMKIRLRQKHPEIAERVVSIALDSVDFDEVRADQILSMMTDKPTVSAVGEEKTNEIIIEEPSQVSSPEAPPPLKHDPLPDQGTEQPSRSEDVPDGCKLYRSSYTSLARGPDPSLPRGPNQALLLPDYVAWTGSNTGLARGPDPSQRCSLTPTRGPDPGLRKGPNRSLAKGSFYSQLGRLSLAETRGK